MLTGILDIAERDYFIKDILSLSDERKIIEYLLHNKQYISFPLLKNSNSEKLINKKLMEVVLPADVLVVFIERGTDTFSPKGKTILKEDDILTVIGETGSINLLYDRFILPGSLETNNLEKDI